MIPFLSEGQCNHSGVHPANPKPPCLCGGTGNWHPYYYTKFPEGKREVYINEKERERCKNSVLVRSEGNLHLYKRIDGTEFWWYQA